MSTAHEESRWAAKAKELVQSPAPLDKYIADIAKALQSAYEDGKREGYVKGSDAAWSIVKGDLP